MADTPEQRPGRDYDGWLKLLMQRPVWREAFLELCTDLPPALRRRTFPWPTEWVNHHLGKELADKLLAVEGDDSDLAGLILIEFQSTYDAEMANRIRSYQWNAWNFAAAEGRLTANGSRPWIHALVFHTGPAPWPANPVWIADRVLPGGEVVQELVPLKVVSIHDFSDEETETRNPFLVIVRMLRLVNRLREEPGLEQQAEALAQVGRFSDALDRLLPNDAALRRETAQLQHSFFWYDLRELGVEVPVVDTLEEATMIYDTLAESLKASMNNMTAEAKAQGRAEGKAEGKAEGEATLLSRAVAHFFPDQAEDFRKFLESHDKHRWPDIEEVLTWKGSGADFMKWLRQ